MRDMQASLVRLRSDAVEAALIRDLATDPVKRELYTRLADHLAVLAREVEAAIVNLNTQHGNDPSAPTQIC